MNEEPLPFIHAMSDRQLARLEEQGSDAIRQLTGQVRHLKRKLQAVAEVIRDHGDTELQLRIGNVLVGRPPDEGETA